MKNNPLKAGFILLLCVCTTIGLNAQGSMEVLKNDASKQSFELSNVRKLTFPTGNLVITPFIGSPVTISFAELRNLNFGNVKILEVPELISESTFEIYPNPTESDLVIKGYERILQLTIFDLQGKRMLQMKPSTTDVTLNISEFARGVYVLQVTTTSQTLLKKIIKK